MNGKDFLDYLKKLPEDRAISIIDDMNKTANDLADRLTTCQGLLIELSDYVLRENDDGDYFYSYDINLNKTAQKINEFLEG